MSSCADPPNGWKCKCKRAYTFRKDQLQCPFCFARNPNPPAPKEGIWRRSSE